MGQLKVLIVSDNKYYQQSHLSSTPAAWYLNVLKLIEW